MFLDGKQLGCIPREANSTSVLIGCFRAAGLFPASDSEDPSGLLPIQWHCLLSGTICYTAIFHDIFSGQDEISSGMVSDVSCFRKAFISACPENNDSEWRLI